MADKYNFRVLVVDLSDVSLELALARNENRLYQEDGLRYVPRNILISFYEKMEPIPKDFDSINGAAKNADKLFYE